MKRFPLFLVLFFAVSFFAKAQESNENTVFDYSETKHELSLDIAPVIQGNYPSSLMYRKHYISKKGNNVALRLGAIINSSFGSTDNLGGSINTAQKQSFGIDLFAGKEWQKTIHRNIIGYYGMDLGIGYSSSSLEMNPVNNSSGDVSSIENTSGFRANAIGFLGMRYHISKHFSVSAETSLLAGYNYFSRESSFGGEGNPILVDHNFNISMMPLRAIRFAFHF